MSTPLHVAAYSGNVDEARELLKHGRYDVNCTDALGSTPLHWACYYTGCMDMVRMLISEFQADTTLQDTWGYTPLHDAAHWGKEEVALTLITEFGCDTTIRGRYGRTLLHSACARGCLTLAKLLIRDYCADINALDENKNTPLHVAAKFRQHELFLALISEFSCDMTVRNKNGDTILGITDINGDTILHIACAAGNTQLVNKVYKHASLLATNDNGNTFLHKAAARGHKECVEALLQLGAPIMLRNAAGETARDIAYCETKLLLDAYITENQAKIYVHYDKIIQQAKKKYSNAERLTRVFVIGNPGAGKSSFVETMKREGFFESFSRVSESSVPLHTVGIVPSIHTSKHYTGESYFTTLQETQNITPLMLQY